jgi:membrane associated rhomboid family serine protease
MTAGRRIDLAGRSRELGRCGFTWSSLAVLVGLQWVVHLSDKPEWWYGTFGLNRVGFLSGEVWRIFTYGLFHGSWLHLALNAICLLLLGARLEATVGPRVVAASVGGGVVAGGILHLLLVPTASAGLVMLVGISGGCVALLLLLTTLSPESRMWPLPVSGRSLGWGILLGELMLALTNPSLRLPGFAAAGDFLSAQGFGDWFRIGHACHAGGGIAGYLVGRWVLRPRVTLARLQQDRRRREG